MPQETVELAPDVPKRAARELDRGLSQGLNVPSLQRNQIVCAVPRYQIGGAGGRDRLT
jgi:hypothetical protein